MSEQPRSPGVIREDGTPRRTQPGPHRPPDSAPAPPPLVDEFQTDRIDIVAFLMCRGQMVLRYARVQGRVQFFFSGRQACGELQTEYMIAEGVVVARTFAVNMDWARAALHQV